MGYLVGDADGAFVRPSSSRLLAALDGSAQVVVLRAPQGFGKTTLLRQWLESQPADTAAFLSGKAVALDRFWSGLAEHVGMPPTAETEAAARDQVRSRLQALKEPFAIIVDDFQLLKDPGLVVQLLDLVEACPQLRLLVATRARHVIEAQARDRAETAVFTVDDLSLSAEESREFAGTRGVHLTAEDAQLVVDATGGWPAMIHKVVRRLARRSGTPERLGETLRLMDADLSAWLMGELVSSQNSVIMSQLAVAEHLTIGAARFLTGNERISESLDELVTDGLLIRSVDPDTNEQVYEFPTAIRRLALAGLGRPTGADIEDRGPQLAQWFADEGRPDLALAQAAAARDWEFIAGLFESSWSQLYNAEEELLVSTMRQLPEEVARAYPKAHAVRYIVLGTAMSPADLPQPMARTFKDVVEIAHKMGAINAVEIAVAEYIVLRRSGRYSDAVRVGKVAHYLAEIIGSRVPAYIVPMVPMARLQLALTFELAGRGKDAAEQLAISLAALESLTEVNSFELNQITGVAAAKAAMDGDFVASEVWSDREVAVEETVPRVWLMPFVPSGHQIARAIQAVDRLDKAAAEAPLVQLRLQERRDELWAMSAWAQARYDLAWSDPVAAIRNLEMSRVRHREWHTHDSAAHSILLSAEVDIFLSAGQGNQAATRLLKTESKHPAVQLARARLAYHTEDYETAGALTREIMRSRGSSDRWRVHAMIVRAGALARTKGIEASLETWRRASTLAARMGNTLLPFAMADTEVRDQAALRLDDLAEIVRWCRWRGVDALLPRTVHVINLTAREQAVLEKLALDVPVSVIAREHYVSEATVKTQLNSLYTKLGVHSRADAVIVAANEGLLD